ncbi:tyrosine-type recombinase/integrase [Winogradskyella sp. PG-2]|uniref:tyrosine-type recombinase/integrase n=1 Tax=Winogradskyella sp. PG-2 TaxID=754409 RepID=UPI0004588885|nr:site-specific integrase [Winogradskyella sp. PG-2]BAO76351.1 hypothetical protein WPG_2121 [Winogradskyella sp. PG-2]
MYEFFTDNEWVDYNFVKDIKKLRTTPKKHMAYSIEMQENIFEFLKTKDPDLLLYLKFVSYSFLRPLEVCRLKVGNIDLNNKRLSVQAKNSPFKTKIIPEILFSDLPDLTKYNKESFLFTAEGIGKFTDTKLENRRSYFTSRFKKAVQNDFDLDFEHTLYSFRHTFITKVYRELRKKYPPYEAKCRLMEITGHTSMKALESYLRDADAELPKDYSDML